MDEREKVKIRISRWIEHNAAHQGEYERLADSLEHNGENEAARYLRELAEYHSKGMKALRMALAALKG